MPGKLSLRGVGFVFPATLVALLISSPTGAQTNYILNPVAPNYIDANTVLPFPVPSDDVFLPVPLPFPFAFYGVEYDRAYVSTNGFISFFEGPEDASFSNVCLSTESSIARPNTAIYAFWNDLYVDNAASVRTELVGTASDRQFVIEWRNVTFYDDRDRRVDFEIVLSETGAILLQYRNIASDDREMGSSATVGVENQTGYMAVQYSCNTANIRPNESGQFALGFSQAPRTVTVPVDVKPMGCPNPLNVGSKGVLPFAILGTADFDVTTINPNTVTLAGVAPLRWSLEDVGTPYEPFVGRSDPYQCSALGPDGHPDLTFKFDTQSVVERLGVVADKAVRVLQMRGQLLNGTEIQGEDVVIVLKGGKEK